MPLEITPLPEDSPESPPRTQGYIDGDNIPYENPEINHRPHPFALIHGEDGPLIAFGQLQYRFDTLRVYQQLQHPNVVDEAIPSTGNKQPLDNISIIDASQDKIMGVKSVIPTINSPSGAAMGAEMPFVYHQLDGYGDVYLNWKVKLNAASDQSRISECYVSTTDITGGNPTSSAIQSTRDFDDAGLTYFKEAPLFIETNRFTDSYSTSAATFTTPSGHAPPDQEGVYSVKLGQVKDPALVKQAIDEAETELELAQALGDQRVKQYVSSDVVFSFLVLIKHLESLSVGSGAGNAWITDLVSTTGNNSRNGNIADPAPES